MPTHPESQAQTILKDPIMKWIARIIGAVVLLFFIVVLGKAMFGKHVRVFGIEINMKEAATDTLFSSTHIDTVWIPASLIKPGESVKPFKKGTTNSAKPMDTMLKVVGKNVVAGTNNGIVGDNATVNGIIPRTIKETDVKALSAQLPRRDISIRFVAYGGVDGEVESVKNQFISHFKRLGFTNIETAFRLMIGSPPPDGIKLDTFPNMNILEIHIPPKSQ